MSRIVKVNQSDYKLQVKSGGTITLDAGSTGSVVINGNLIFTGSTMEGSWQGPNITVPYGGTGTNSLTGYVKGNGTAAFTAVTTIPSTDVIGFGTLATQDSNSITITGGTANGLIIGNVTPAAATFSTLRINSTLSVAGSTGTLGQALISNGASAPSWQYIPGIGTVTSVSGIGIVNGLYLSGTVTGSGNLTLGGSVNDVALTTGTISTLPSSSFDIVNKLYADTITAGNIPNDTTTDAIELAFTPITTTAATNTITISNPSFINYYRAGQNLKIFGANLTTDNTDLVDAVSMRPVIKNGFIGTVSGSLFSYKVAQFRVDNGKIGPSGLSADITNVNPDIFNTSNNLTVRFNRTNSSYGILIYRKITGSVNTGTYNLIAILGSQEMGSSTEVSWTDFYDVDSTAWSKKTVVRNEYQESTGTVHFPLQPPESPSKGWVSAQIQSVNTTSNRLVLTSSFNFNSQVLVSHDDTSAIQTAINSRVANNSNSLKLSDKTYFVSSLDIPADFTVYGASKQTRIRKLSWGSNDYSTNKIFKTVNNAVRSNISITNVTIDGNMQNQYLFQETIDEYINYTIDIKGIGHTFENLTISNAIGGGIASPTAQNLTINLCQIQDSGMSDRYGYSPISVVSSFQILITNNVMQNFSSALDASSCNIAVLTGNIVNNCGSGILIYGSTKLISSPNLILGPAGEFISGPDILNSEYDSVNIILEPNTNYESDRYVYQENGAAFDITSTRNRQVLTYRVDKLRKIDNVEELFSEVLINGSSPITALVGTYVTGEFKFQITSANVNELTTTYSYSAQSQAIAGYIGLVYRALLTEYAPSGDISETIAPVITSGGVGITLYRVTLSNVSNIGIGTVVRTLSHGGTPNLDSVLGTITNINTVTNQYTISYALSSISDVGDGGQLTVENTFVLAKGRIL